MTNLPQQPRRAIGIVRVSHRGQRDEERFFSPEEQRERIEAVCHRDGLELVEVHEEIDLSGGRSLDRRRGLMAAVQAIEEGRAEVVAAAYFDRLFRSLRTQGEVVERVESVGGTVLAVDVGEVSAKSAGQWLTGTIMGAFSEYYRRSARERSAAGQAKAVAHGKTPWARVPLGYRRRADGTLEVGPESEVALVRRCFEMRAAGDSYMTIRAMLKEHGISRSARGVDVLLHNRIYLGEIHFGKIVNPRAHDPIVDRDLFARIQRMRIARGPQPDSNRLLSRLGVLHCGSCGARLSTMKLPRQANYPIYRCASTSDCERHVTISAEIAERFVWDAVKAKLADAKGKASAAHNARLIVEERDRAQAALDHAVRSFTAADVLEEPASAETLAELRAERDRCQDAVDRLPPEIGQVVHVDDNLPLSTRRDLIRAVVDRVDVAPSGPGLPRGTARLSLKFLG